jgi:hypothetical protein
LQIFALGIAQLQQLGRLPTVLGVKAIPAARPHSGSPLLATLHRAAAVLRIRIHLATRLPSRMPTSPVSSTSATIAPSPKNTTKRQLKTRRRAAIVHNTKSYDKRRAHQCVVEQHGVAGGYRHLHSGLRLRLRLALCVVVWRKIPADCQSLARAV